MAKTCVFNINGTLLDLSALDPFFTRVFGAAVFRELWWQTVLHTASSLTLSERFADFGKVGERTLESMAEERGQILSAADWVTFRRGLLALPVYGDAKPGLEALKTAGYRLVGLSNSSRAAATAPLLGAGFHDLFDDILSAETVDAFKPAPAPYRHAAEKLKAVPKQLWFVAAHAWDTMGAHQAGFKTALILRPGHGLNENFPRPDAKAASLPELAVEIQNRDRTLLQKVFGTGRAGAPEARPAV